MDANCWLLESTNGCYSLGGTPDAGQSTHVDGGSIAHDIRIAFCPFDEAEPETVVSIKRIPLASTRIEELQQAMRVHVELPMHRLRDESVDITVDLCAKQWHSLIISLGDRREIETGPNGVGCQVEVSLGNFELHTRFATDVTCLSAFLDGLALATRR